jgi:hypothetical protein
LCAASFRQSRRNESQVLWCTGWRPVEGQIRSSTVETDIWAALACGSALLVRTLCVTPARSKRIETGHSGRLARLSAPTAAGEESVDGPVNSGRCHTACTHTGKCSLLLCRFPARKPSREPASRSLSAEPFEPFKFRRLQVSASVHPGPARPGPT